MARKLILKSTLSPGDLCTLTAAIESLHKTYPGQYLTDIRTSCDELFLGNPHITRLRDDEADCLEMHYTDLVCCSDGVPNPFLRGYCYDLGKQLGVPLELCTNRPHIYLMADDQIEHPLANLDEPPPNRYWILTAGIKRDFTLKQWPVEYYQSVIDHFRDKIRFVQIGSAEHDHPQLEGVINLVGKTDVRQLIRLVYHASGGLGPITFLQHLCAAFEKPYVALLGGREPVIWTQYPLQTTLHTMGKLPCCLRKACWRSRVVPLNDGCEQDKSLCDFPVLGMQRAVGKCMAMIEPLEVIRAIDAFSHDIRWDTDSTRTRITPIPSQVAKCPVPVVDKPLEMIAHSAWGFDVKIVPAWGTRDWMDSTQEKFAYHCLPMVIANQSGWFILAPHDAVVDWNGGADAASLKIEIPGSPKSIQAVSNAGSGIMTWQIPYVFRTPPGWNLLCRGPANHVKDGLFPLEGMVETDWTTAPFSMNWKCTRPGRFEFKEGEPIAMIVPQKRRDMEIFVPRFMPLDANPELRDGYEVWTRSRQEFWQRQREGDPESLKQKYQKHYFRGCSNHGLFFADHQNARELRAFEGPA